MESSFLDLKKVFDTVDHKILLMKLDLYGVRETAHDWFRSYLSNRTQYCRVNGQLSQPMRMVIFCQPFFFYCMLKICQII